MRPTAVFYSLILFLFIFSPLEKAHALKKPQARMINQVINIQLGEDVKEALRLFDESAELLKPEHFDESVHNITRGTGKGQPMALVGDFNNDGYADIAMFVERRNQKKGGCKISLLVAISSTTSRNHKYLIHEINDWLGKYEKLFDYKPSSSKCDIQDFPAYLDQPSKPDEPGHFKVESPITSRTDIYEVRGGKIHNVTPDRIPQSRKPRKKRRSSKNR